MTSFHDYLRAAVPTRQELDVFLDPREPSMARFDPELGYILGNNIAQDGIGGCRTIQTVDVNGARSGGPYRDRPYRINTYGNSFTQCAQVSDGETWQAYLAGHLGEPLGNWGVGGFGSYQAWRRLKRTEASANGAEYVLLYFWGDDHYRSLLRCRHALTYRWWDSHGGHAFHGNFWSHLEMDLNQGRLVEVGNLLATPEALYQMCDPEFMVNALQDDLMLQLSVYLQRLTDWIDLPMMTRLADCLGLPAPQAGDPDQRAQQLTRLRDAYALAAARYVADSTANYCVVHNKKLLILLLDLQVTRQLLLGQPRSDQAVLDYLQAQAYRSFDMNLVHLADYQQYKLTPDAYLKRYLIGHYNPAGNHLFAYALAPALVEWLEPKPTAYQPGQGESTNYDGYLPYHVG